MNIDSLESIWIDILLPKSKPIAVGCFYRPPTCKAFLENLESSFLNLRSDCELYLLGDFNINFNSQDEPLLKRYKDVLSLFNCSQIIDIPTRITDTTATTLDHIITNSKEKILQYGTLNVGLSDHLITYCTRKIWRCQINRHNTIRIRSMRHYNKESLLNKLANVNWESTLSCNEVNEAWFRFITVFLGVIDEIAPVKEVRIKCRTEPWMNDNILLDIRQRDKHLFLFKKYHCKDMYSKYCKLRNKIQRDVKKAKSEYFKTKIEENKGNPKKLWQTLKSTGFSQQSKSQNTIVLNNNGHPCTEPFSVANLFNKFFTNVASLLTDKLPNCNNIYGVNTTPFKQYYKNKGIKKNSFVLQTISNDFVLDQLNSLNPSKSTGLDNIPARFLKDGANIIVQPITHIVNLSLSLKVFPNDMKFAKVTPLFKKNNRQEVSNYRPISILPEKAVFVQLHNYLNENNVINDFQSGFRENYSTDTALINLTDHIRSEISKGNFTGLVVLDIQKAFDTVNHQILLQKLVHMGIDKDSLLWFESYLKGR
ncbi:uncharacterized protein [Antedon mediterranea]|uniref:uncharacterized protein n=1 Tax=Antedon mediterranea TaxID=105859 RepID=UPI003AF93AF3